MNKKKSLALFMAISIATLAVGCSKNNEDANKGANTSTNVESNESSQKKEEVGQIILSGSSTLAPVMNEAIIKFTEKNKTWNTINEKYGNEDIDIVVSEGGSGAAIKALLDDTANFGLVSRPVTDEEKSKIENYNEFNLGTDALTISINPENKLLEYKKDGLTTEELSKIFSGEFKYWDEVDSNLPHEEIVVITRDISGGAHQVFQEKVMGDKEVSKDVIQAPSMGALVTKIIENKNSIGYASFGVVNQNQGKVIPLNIDGIEPTAANILSGDYKISRPLLVITKGELSEAEKGFIDMCTSAEGMKIVEDLGFVPAK
ncbi:phosphate ABC transporter substrate-binding protein [Clostridium sp.]|uniref:phosphate ABC transporter substrate-binding protein n=1 Tax=Clostridium sp. TaxID=1506 RepID=UPI0032179486